MIASRSAGAKKRHASREAKEGSVIQTTPGFTSENVKALLRDRRSREDVLDAVLAVSANGPAPAMGDPEAEGDLVRIFRRADALGRLLATEDGVLLLASYRRIDGILRAEEEALGASHREKPARDLYVHKTERELAVAITLARSEARTAMEREDFAQAMHALATLRPYIEAFLAQVSFDDSEPGMRENRLRLLNELRGVVLAVVDLSKIED
jgi:glycyl-tRNA synthetase beta chain